MTIRKAAPAHGGDCHVNPTCVSHTVKQFTKHTHIEDYSGRPEQGHLNIKCHTGNELVCYQRQSWESQKRNHSVGEKISTRKVNESIFCRVTCLLFLPSAVSRPKLKPSGVQSQPHTTIWNTWPETPSMAPCSLPSMPRLSLEGSWSCWPCNLSFTDSSGLCGSEKRNPPQRVPPNSNLQNNFCQH